MSQSALPVVAVTLPDEASGCAACAQVKEPAVAGDGCFGSATWQVQALPSRCREHRSARLTVTYDEVRVEMTVRYLPGLPGSRTDPLRKTMSSIVGVADGSLDILGIPTLKAAERLARLVTQGMPADEDTVRWAYARWDSADLVRRARGAGMTAHDADRWAQGLSDARAVRAPGITPEETLAWWMTVQAEKLAFWDAHDWTSVGVRHPADRPHPLTAQDAAALLGAQITDFDVRWAGVAAVCPRLVEYGVDRGVAPEAVVALFAALADPLKELAWDGCEHPNGHCGWETEQVDAAIALADRLVGDQQQWVDVAACLRAAMTPAEAVEHLRSGADMGPVRLLAALGD